MRRTAVVHVSEFGSISNRRKDEADERAEDLLENMLDWEFDPVPCPRCGDFQPEMADHLKRERFRRLLRHQGALLVVAALAELGCLLFTATTVLNAHHQTTTNIVLGAAIAGTSGIVAVTNLCLWAWNRRAYATRTADYDPNDPADRDTRFEVARRRAKPIEPD